jgi:hypothetical protein
MILRGFMGSAGREAITQASVGVAAQARTMPRASRWVRSRPRRRLDRTWLAPQLAVGSLAAARDAAAVVDRQRLDERTNPLPREATPVHERAIDQAQIEVLHGRPARVGAFVAEGTEAAIDGPSLLGRVFGSRTSIKANHPTGGNRGL